MTVLKHMIVLPEMNKRGGEFVEAAIVLPLIILTILSMIMAALFLFRHQIKQSEAEKAVIDSVLASDDIFSIKRKNISSMENIKGTAAGSMSESSSVRAYALRQADAVMAGELAG